MKTKIIVIVLAVFCAGLVVALLAVKKYADEERGYNATLQVHFSNQVTVVNRQLEDLSQVNLTLSNQMAAARQQLEWGAEQVAHLSNSLAAASATLASTETSLATAEEQVTNLNNRIADLEAQNRVLDAQSISLSNQLASLETQIAETRSQLAASSRNAAFLQTELQKQLAQKAELEHKFNDVEELRFQIKKLKDELWMARRLQLANKNDNKKGGQLLMEHDQSAFTKSPSTNYDLNVEVGSDGSVKVIPPPVNTNAPGH